MSEVVIELDDLNPQIAARFASIFNHWRRFIPKYSKLQELQIKSIIDRDKISKSIRIATRKRPIDSETIEKFISKIVRNLEGLGESEIPTPTIGKFIMDGLSSLDKVAYVRFASVYKNFKEAKDFEQFVGNLDDNKS